MSPPFLVVPGWGGSGVDHWQSFWQVDLDAARVELVDWLDARLEVWLDALDAAIAALARRDPRPPVLVAHSLGCIVVAHWARSARRVVRAALLVAPADVDRAACTPILRRFGPVPLEPLPFSSLVVTSDDDPHITVERAKRFAHAWGSDLRTIHSGGHLNAASGLGRFRGGLALLAELVRRTEREDAQAVLGG